MSVFYRPDSLLEKMAAEIKAEIAGRDYQVIKAARQGVPVDQLYPGHTAWYEEKIAILNGMEKGAEKTSK
jgi:hypothetical protein